VPDKATILAALSRITGPDGKTPLSESTALSDIVTHDGRVYFSIAIDPLQAQALEPMRSAAEKAVKALKGVEGVVATLTSDKPQGNGHSHSHAHSHAGHSHAPGPQQGQRTTGARTQIELPGVKHLVAVASGKGGVGKSTTTANLALAFAAEGWRVGVLDADVFGPSQPTLFGLAGTKPETRDGKLVPLEAFGIKVMSIGFLVDPETAMVWRGPMVMSAVQQLLRDVHWGHLDILLIDMPPGTGDTQLTMAQSVTLSGAVIVSTPQDLALIDARRGIAMFEKTHIPVLGVVENMSYFICDAGKRYNIFGHGGAKAEAARMGATFLGEIPLVMAIREGSDEGVPIVAAEPAGPQAIAYRSIAAQLQAKLAGGTLKPAPAIRFN
jgi:ATP-binding protein involved in chromosome partitioning